MVLAYHVIFTAYGFWLPNDPRGSWSTFVRSWELLRFGAATKIETRRSVAGRAHDRDVRDAAQGALRHPPVTFNGKQAIEIIAAFQEAVQKSGYTCYACSILPDHVHMVIARHQYRVEQIVRQLKQSATCRLLRLNLHPLASGTSHPPSPWARGCWKVFLNTTEDIHRAIRYVRNNPIKEGLRPQHWSLVSPFRASP